MLDSHTGLFFLSHYVSAPRLIYALRSAPVYLDGAGLGRIDEALRSAAASVANVEMSDQAWQQASLPVRYGGLDLCKSASLALPCYIVYSHYQLPQPGRADFARHLCLFH